VSSADPQHRRLLAGAHTEGPHGRLVFITATTDLDAADDLLVAALELAGALVAAGWGVALISGKLTRAAFRDVDAVVSLVPDLDVGPIPRATPLLGWAGRDIEQWRRAEPLAAYDLLLAGSDLAAMALRAVFAGPVDVFPVAVDPVRWPVQHSPSGPPVVPAPTPAGDLGHGCVSGRVPAALAAGTLPVTNGALGLAELGLDEVPVARSAAELRAITAHHQDNPQSAADLVARLRELVMQRHTVRHRATQLIAALPAARAAAAARPVTIACFGFTRNNPYQELLYAEAVAAGVRVVPTWYPMWRGFPRDDGGRLDNQILHVHWTSAIVARAPGTFSAYRRFDKFRQGINDFRSRGGQVLWTVHNLLPHDVRHRTLEEELFRFLARTADRIHVLGPATAAAAADLGGLPVDRVTVLEHSSYHGVYPDFIGRAEARRRLGLAPEDRAVLIFGEIRPYKGLDLLLDAFRAAAGTDPRWRLLVAGGLGATPADDPVLEQCRADPRVITHFDRVADSEVQVWLRATDLVVLPYRDIVNSGTLHLALTFGRPVIAPRAGEVARLLASEWAVGFAPGDVADLTRALQTAADTLCSPAATASAARAAAELPPEDMAADFLTLLGTHLTPGLLPGRAGR
jgi:glycosyltransferase involved in cell wall biosynthesis